MAHCCVQNFKPKQSVPLPIRSAQIQASLDEANTTDVLPCISLPKPRNLTSNGSRTRHHTRTMAPRTHTRRRRFSTPMLDLSYTRRQYGLVVHRSTWPENLVVIRRCMRHHAPPGFLASHSRAGGLIMHLPRAEMCCWCHLTSLDDVITPRQQPHKHVHVSPSPRHRTSAAPLFNPWVDSETRNRPGPISVDFDPGPVDFNFLHWPLIKSQNFR